MKKKIFFGILCACVGGLLIYWNVPYSPQKKTFDKEMQAYANKMVSNSDVVSKEEIEKLPLALQRYCEYIGIEGMPKYMAVRTYFKDTDF